MNRSLARNHAVINGNHKSEDEVPQFPFFTGRKAGARRVGTPPANLASNPTSTTTQHSHNNDKMRQRKAITKQLREMKGLKDDGILLDDEYEDMRVKLVSELGKL
ncbi:uncharacterized protein LOC5507907 [Nematostella vectensis]|uniref:uncharacterized protein LOC5507907 n=1 Tax=Nematostella vectensis TaxID=45351 RepID=UPI002076FFD0|nr:uncharacterized protein LOC5507907 [Nematostella vectensis]